MSTDRQRPQPSPPSRRLASDAGDHTHNVVCFSNHLVTDRMLYHSSFLTACSPTIRPLIWSPAPRSSRFPYQDTRSALFTEIDLQTVASLPEPVNKLRRFVDYMYEDLGGSQSRESFWRLRRSRKVRPSTARARAVAKAVALPWIRRPVERTVRQLVKGLARGDTAESLMRDGTADALLAMCPFRPNQMAATTIAQRLGIATCAFITSWDNLSTKTRLLVPYDRYLTWSDAMSAELRRFYPELPEEAIRVVGAPQYDVFRDPRFEGSREWLCSSHGLDPSRPIILYCMGSPNLIREDHGLRQFVEAIGSSADKRDYWQLLIRPHPAFEDLSGSWEKARDGFPATAVQTSLRDKSDTPFQDEDSTRHWVAAFKHSDVVINLSSTVIVDAAIFDTPVVNLDFDPEPGAPNGDLVREINTRWDHLRPVLRSDGLSMAKDIAEVVQQTERYLREPGLHRDGRAKIVRHVVGTVDGKAGARMAGAMRDLLRAG